MEKMSDEQKKMKEPEIVTQAPPTEADGGDGSPDGRNDKDDTNSENGKNDTNVKNGKKRGKLIGLLAAAAILIAAAVGIGIYNVPENRVSRYLNLGNRYLEEQNYEQAIIAFEKVITIDERCIEA